MSLAEEVAALSAKLDSTDQYVDLMLQRTADNQYDENAFWLLFGAYVVFFMQCGFALLEAGSVSAKNTKNILLKNVVDACLGGIIWWAFGFPFAYGEGGASPNQFIGGKDFFLSKPDRIRASETFATDLTLRGVDDDGNPVLPAQGVPQYATWMFQWAFAAAAATIVSGAVAERCRFTAYLTYSIFITGFIYPVVVHWGWSSEGWMSPWGPNGPANLGGIGVIDFAGSGIVHMVGGGAALMGAIFLGPRLGRFSLEGKIIDMPGHSTVLATIGTFILWFGWYGFNPVSTLAFEYNETAEKVAVTTTISACAGGLATLSMHVLFNGTIDLTPALNGILGGLVSITGPCSVVSPAGAFCIGLIGGLIEFGSAKLLLKLKIDDPLEASPVHFFCGAWGVFAVGLFAIETDVAFNYGSAGHYGVFYGSSGDQLGVQCVGIIAIAAWTCGMSGIMFGVLKLLKVLRVSIEDEEAGLDLSHHGGSAYA